MEIIIDTDKLKDFLFAMNCSRCIYKYDCEGGFYSCLKHLLFFLQVKEKQTQINNWKFAMPCDGVLNKKCAKKINELSNGKVIGNNNFYCYNKTVGIVFVSKDEFIENEEKELTLSEFLSLEKPQPQKEKLPEWVKPNNFVMFAGMSGYWGVNVLQKIYLKNEQPFLSKGGGFYYKIAPLDPDFITGKERHPQEITKDDLASYDLSKYEVTK